MRAHPLWAARCSTSLTVHRASVERRVFGQVHPKPPIRVEVRSSPRTATEAESPPMSSRADGTIHRRSLHARTGRLLPRPRHRAARDHRPVLDRPRPGPRRHPVLPVCDGGRRAGRRAQPVPRDGLQERGRRPGPRRRQGGHHRGPPTRQDAGAAAGIRTVRGEPRRAVRHGVRRGHLRRGHGHGLGDDAVRDGTVRGERRGRRLVDPHRIRRVPRYAGGRRLPVGVAVAGRPAGGDLRGREGRPAAGRAASGGRRVGRGVRREPRRGGRRCWRRTRRSRWSPTRRR